MAILSLRSLNPLKWPSRQQSRLPTYQRVVSPSTREKYNDGFNLSDDDQEDDSDGELSDFSPDSSPRTRDSRQSSASLASSALMLGKKRFSTSKHSSRRLLYRLPNKVTRWLCLGMIATLVLFILSLIRASQIENRRIANGEIDRGPGAPAQWESFRFLTRYFGGVRSLVPFDQSMPEYPRLKDEQPYNASAQPALTKADVATDEGRVDSRSIPHSQPFAQHPSASIPTYGEGGPVECYVDPLNTVRVPPTRYLNGRPLGFPLNVLGSYELLSLPEDICLEKYGRFGPYGYGYSVRSGGLGLGEHGEMEGSEEVWQTVPQVDFRGVDWADAQRRCYQRNSKLYKELAPRHNYQPGFYIDGGESSPSLQVRDEGLPSVVAPDSSSSNDTTHQGPVEKLARTAVVIRCWDEFRWFEEDIMNLRAVISELSLASGGRYDVHLLVQVKDDARHPIWADEKEYRARVQESVPEEFWGLVTFWTETQMLSVYHGLHDLFTRGPDLPVHGSYRGLQMAMQYFAYNHPEYDHFWQWEMDIRYTGHFHDMFSKLENWAREQPRKGLWERNARFYMPSVHGTWDDFKQMARVQTELGAASADDIWSHVPGIKKKPHEVTKGEQTIWGPLRPNDPKDWFESDDDPEPPTSYERDRYSWGVGEEADYITFNPMFDPAGTTWLLADDITGYNESAGNGKPPRRAHIITASRMSRKLLMTMHRETAFKKHHAFPEMWPATVALQHGYKAVYAPHPIYVDREWPTEYMARVLNAGKNGATGGSRNSVFGGREHNLRGVTWYYNSGFSGDLYRRWLGLRVNNDGGEEFELVADETKDDSSVSQMRGGEGRMCLPPMLLHPVKNVELPVEVDAGELEIPESDPAA